jgi:nickel transport protein
MPACARPVPAVVVALLLLALSASAQAHALLHEVVEGEALIVRLAFPGGDQPWFEPYEVFAPGSETPFQTGRVNANGELSFRPDRAGTWGVRVYTEDGHGVVLNIEVDDAGAAAMVRGDHHHVHGYWSRVLAALGILLGIFGVLMLWRRRHAPTGPGG